MTGENGKLKLLPFSTDCKPHGSGDFLKLFLSVALFFFLKYQISIQCCQLLF